MSTAIPATRPRMVIAEAVAADGLDVPTLRHVAAGLEATARNLELVEWKIRLCEERLGGT